MLRHHERGSVLMLLPAFLLIVVLMGSIAVDFSVAFLAKRELAALATAAANDAATAGADQASLVQGDYILDEQRVLAAAQQAVDSTSSSSVHVESRDVDVIEVDGTPAVRVTLRGRADFVIRPGHIEIEVTRVGIARRSE